MAGTTLSDLVQARRRHLAAARRARGLDRAMHVRTALHLRRVIRAWSREGGE